jgi:ribosomal subunit interface protein
MKIINITSKHIAIDERTRNYIEKKVRKLIDYIPRQARKSATAEVTIVKDEKKGAKNIKCEIILSLPGKQLVAKDIKDGAMAAIDGAETKINGQIRKYKTERRADGVRSGGIMARIKRSLRRRR